MSPTNTTTNDPNVLSWDDVTTLSTELGHGAYIATVGADGRPHVAWVMFGYRPERFWFSTWRDSQKGHNLRTGGEVALHWPQQPERLTFARAMARLVDDRAESDALWDSGLLPYDLGNFFTGRDDPNLLFVELSPIRLTVRSLAAPTDPPKVWTPAS